MALVDTLLADVYMLTKRPDLEMESRFAIRNAVRTAHVRNKFWRDLATTAIAVTVEPVQTIDLSAIDSLFRGVCCIKPTGADSPEFIDTTANDLLDRDGYTRLNAYWGHGSQLKLRAANPVDSYDITYYKYPLITATVADSWIADNYQDVVTLMAAVNVLGGVGEDTIAGRLQNMLNVAIVDLIADNLVAIGS